MFDGLDLAGAAVLLRTGWDRHWRTERYGDPEHPYLDEAGAAHLVDAGATLVGIDSVNIDDTRGGERPAHTRLLAAGIPVVEHLTGLDTAAGHRGDVHRRPGPGGAAWRRSRCAPSHDCPERPGRMAVPRWVAWPATTSTRPRSRTPAP